MPAYQQNLTEELFTISSGDVTDFIYVRPTVLGGATIDGNWSCSTKVVSSDGTEVIPSFAVTELSDDDTEFKVYLTGAQTANLGVDDGAITEYTWSITLTNPTLTPVNTRTLRLRLGVA